MPGPPGIPMVSIPRFSYLHARAGHCNAARRVQGEVTAIDGQQMTGDEGRRIRGQEDAGPTRSSDSPSLPQRYAVQQVLLELR